VVVVEVVVVVVAVVVEVESEVWREFSQSHIFGLRFSLHPPDIYGIT
jgi:hypothetical protein